MQRHVHRSTRRADLAYQAGRTSNRRNFRQSSCTQDGQKRFQTGGRGRLRPLLARLRDAQEKTKRSRAIGSQKLRQISSESFSKVPVYWRFSPDRFDAPMITAVGREGERGCCYYGVDSATTNWLSMLVTPLSALISRATRCFKSEDLTEPTI